MLLKVFQGRIDLLKLKQRHPEHFPFFLESAARSDDHQRSFLFAFPQDEQRINDADALNSACVIDDLNGLAFEHASLTAEQKQYPFVGGWFFFSSYELAQAFEPCLNLPSDPLKTPLMILTRVAGVLQYDHDTQSLHCIVEGPQYQAEFEELCAWVEEALSTSSMVEDSLPPLPLSDLRSDPPECFLEAVGRIQEHIKAGDVFQVNLSRLWQAHCAGETSGNAVRLYQQLRQHNPAPFACLVDYTDFSIISSSPERLFRIQDRQVETRPIAGTHPKGQTPEEDERLRQALFNNPKEAAEHIMLVDLERNDLGRLCEPHSVQVDELMCLESYEHVHHIVSNIRGQLKADIGLGDVFRAVFPGGTITGCPKVRCMQIIAEQELVGRGAYTGSVGYVSLNGYVDSNILIRTMVLKQERLHFRTGAGIVYDSQDQLELAETRHKAKGLLKALGAYVD